jgi:hypothetical protein
VTIRDARNGTLVHALDLPAPPTDIGFSQDGSKLVVRDAFEFRIFGIGDGRQAEAGGTTALLRELRSSPIRAERGTVAGRTAILGNSWIVVPDRKSLRLVSINTGEDITLSHEDDFPAFVVSGDETTIATKSRNTIRVWTILDDGAPEHSFLASSARGSDVRIGRRSASAVLVARMDGARDYRPIFAGAHDQLFAADGPSLRRIRYRPQEIEAEVCRRIGRGLTVAELAAFFSPSPPIDPCGS